MLFRSYAYQIFCELAGEKFEPVRALRICTTGLMMCEEPIQINMFANIKEENLSLAIDKIKNKFGNNKIVLAKDVKF